MMDTDAMKYIQQLEDEVDRSRRTQKNLMQGMDVQSSMFQNNEQGNLVQWQLDLREELERIDHLLKGHQLKFDDKGNQMYVEPASDDLKPFNDYGVQLIMNIISFYLNRNTILSNYDEDTINWKVYDFGIELTDLMMMKYEEMGMNTPTKKKLYPMVVKELVDTIHSTYLRALNGGERDSLRKAMYITQSADMGQGNMAQMMAYNKPKFNIFKPSSWTG